MATPSPSAYLKTPINGEGATPLPSTDTPLKKALQVFREHRNKVQMTRIKIEDVRKEREHRIKVFDDVRYNEITFGTSAYVRQATSLIFNGPESYGEGFMDHMSSLERDLGRKRDLEMKISSKTTEEFRSSLVRFTIQLEERRKRVIEEARKYIKVSQPTTSLLQEADAKGPTPAGK